MMQRQMIKIVAPLALVALTACESSDPASVAFNSEAGDAITGEFGNATMTNTLAMTDRRNYAVSLSKRFASEVNTTVNFAFNRSYLDENAKAALRRQADWIRQFPEVRFKVFGYADAVGTRAYNKRLGMRRARNVVNYLVSQGISRSRLEAVVSYGEERPLVHTSGRNRQNRRAVTDVSGFVDGHPMLLDGKYAKVIYREYIASAVPNDQVTEATGTGAN